MRVWKSRAALGSLAVALLSFALMAPTAMAGNGNGGSHGQGGGQGQGHGKPDDAGASRGNGQAKHEKKDKHEKKQKPDKASKGAKTLALACKDGGWQALQDSDGAPFSNQGRCVSYAVHGGVLVPVEPEEPAAPEDPAAEPDEQGGENYVASLPCKDGGWQALQRPDGTRFDNQGSCVSYAVQGGILEAIPVVTISFVPSVLVDGGCDATAVISHFDPSTDYLGELTVDGVVGGVTVIATDALGDASVPLATFLPGQVLALSVDGVLSGDITVACLPDVEAP